MSYQFEDDSALEELLNQQLDRRRPNIRAGSAAKTTSQISQQIPSQTSVQKAQRPATAIMTSNKQDEAEVSLEHGKEAPKGKLASWLEGPKKLPVAPSVAIDTDEPVKLVDVERQTTTTRDELDVDSLTENRLQEMSKQRLVQLILGKILPQLRKLEEKLSKEELANVQVEELKRQLQLERAKFESADATQNEKLRLIETSWSQMSKLLEARLEQREQEFKELVEKQKALLNQVEEENRIQISSLSENFKIRLADEQKQFEETLKRREETHRLELESKLKVNCDLFKLESITSEWNRMIEKSLEEFVAQFKSIECLLDKQTFQISSNNADLAKKSKLMSEQLASFEKRGEKLFKLADNIGESWPKVFEFREQNESLLKRISNQLDNFVSLEDDLRAQERELTRLKDELRKEKEKVNQERFQLGLDSNRLAYKEERLNELEMINEQSANRLLEERKQLDEKEAEARVLRLTLNEKSVEIRQQNHELHLIRKRLTERDEELQKSELRLSDERKLLDERRKENSLEEAKLVDLRESAQKELNQLNRLQKALVCSICLDRLFKSGACASNRWLVDRNVGPAPAPAHHEPTEKNQNLNFKLELTKLNNYLELDGKKLEAENKYVQLLSSR